MAEIQLFEVTMLQDLSPGAEVGSNLQTLGDNGSFEDIRSNWGFANPSGFTVTRSLSFPWVGTYTAQVEADATGTTGTTEILPCEFDVESGKSYVVRCRVSSNSVTPIAQSDVKLKIFSNGGTGGLFTEDQYTTVQITNLNASNTNLLVETYITSSATRTVTELGLYLETTNTPVATIAGGLVFVDAFEAYEIGYYPDFQQGKSINILLDDTDESLLVRRGSDDALLTASDCPPTLRPKGATSSNPPYTRAGGIIAESNYQYCSGNDLNRWLHNIDYAYPFAAREIVTDAAGCQGVSCGLVVADYTVTDASGGAANGQITVSTAQLGAINNPVQFSLSEFNYGDGQSSGTFSNLLPGTYRIYIVDSANCRTSIQLEVRDQAFADYGVKLRIGYKDLNGKDGRFDILEKDYVGSITEVTSAGTPVVYNNLEKDQFDLFKEPIRASNVVVTIPELTKFAYRDYFTEDSRKYLGIWYKDVGAGYNELFRGYLTPNVFQSPYTWQPDISLTFIDGLNRLELFDYADGNFLYSDKKLIKVIAEGLNKCDLSLPINVAINMYEFNHDIEDTDDPLDQTFIDQETFYDDGEPQNYFDVITRILQPFGAKLLQWDGAWWIIRIPENRESSFDYRTFDANGDYTANGSYSPRKNLELASVTTARGVLANQDATYEIIGRPRNLKVNIELDGRPSILENYDFEILENNESFLWTFIPNGTLTYGTINELPPSESQRNVFTFNHENNDPFSDDAYLVATQKQIQYRNGDKIEVSFEYAIDQFNTEIPFVIVKTRIKVGGYYLDQDLTWSTDEKFYEFYPSPSVNYTTLTVKAPIPTETEDTVALLDFRVYDIDTRSFTYGSLNQNSTFTDGESALRSTSVNVKDGTQVSLISGTLEGVVGAGVYYFEYISGTDAEDIPNVVRTSPYNGKIFILKKKLYPLANVSLDKNANDQAFINNVVIRTLPDGIEQSEEATINLQITPNSDEDIDYDISVLDLPTEYLESGASIRKFQYNNFLKLSDGSYTQRWKRDGVTERQNIQKIFTTELSRQYSTQTNKISGTVTTINQGTHMDITPLDVLIETQDSNKIYYINGITIDDKNLNYQINLIDSKATDVDDGGTGSEFQGDFNGDFGNQFDTTYN